MSEIIFLDVRHEGNLPALRGLGATIYTVKPRKNIPTHHQVLRVELAKLQQLKIIKQQKNADGSATFFFVVRKDFLKALGLTLQQNPHDRANKLEEWLEATLLFG